MVKTKTSVGGVPKTARRKDLERPFGKKRTFCIREEVLVGVSGRNIKEPSPEKNQKRKGSPFPKVKEILGRKRLERGEFLRRM